MASVLTIRKLPEDVQALLRQRAAASGRSVEAEAREIIALACAPRLKDDWWYGLARRRAEHSLQRNARSVRRLDSLHLVHYIWQLADRSHTRIELRRHLRNSDW